MDVLGKDSDINTVHNDNFKGTYYNAEQISEYLPGNRPEQ